jgi:PPM family protein phosphatase
MIVTTKIISASSSGQDRVASIDTPEGHLLILADGAGGLGDGEAAADFVIHKVSTSGVRSIDECKSLLSHLDIELEVVGQATTVIAIISNGKIFGASVGDSGAWLVGKTTYTDLTDAQIQKPLLGSGRAYPVGFGPYDVRENKIILASDGLFKYVPHNTILSLVRNTNINELAVKLTDAARLPSGALQDDIAVILVDL